MFIRRQDLIDRFAANFLETADGQILFQPPKAEVGVPITWEEHADVMAAFERTYTVNLAINLAVFAGAGALGFYLLLTEGRYVPFFIGIAVAFVFSTALQIREGLSLLLPFIRRRDELLKALSQIEAGPGLSHRTPS